MNRRFIVIILAVCLVFTVSACGKKPDDIQKSPIETTKDAAGEQTGDILRLFPEDEDATRQDVDRFGAPILYPEDEYDFKAARTLITIPSGWETETIGESLAARSDNMLLYAEHIAIPTNTYADPDQPAYDRMSAADIRARFETRLNNQVIKYKGSQYRRSEEQYPEFNMSGLEQVTDEMTCFSLDFQDLYLNGLSASDPAYKSGVLSERRYYVYKENHLFCVGIVCPKDSFSYGKELLLDVVRSIRVYPPEDLGENNITQGDFTMTVSGALDDYEYVTDQASGLSGTRFCVSENDSPYRYYSVTILEGDLLTALDDKSLVDLCFGKNKAFSEGIINTIDQTTPVSTTFPDKLAGWELTGSRYTDVIVMDEGARDVDYGSDWNIDTMVFTNGEKIYTVAVTHPLYDPFAEVILR